MDYYKVTPRVVPADKVSEIRIEPMFEHAEFFSDPGRIEIACRPYDGLMEDGSYQGFGWGQVPEKMRVKDWRFDGKAIVFRFHFAGEQEHNVMIFEKDENGNTKRMRRAHLYSVKEDLYALRPFRGNFHIHSTSSDGREEPRYVAARFRQMGMDFCAISDHGNYDPSIVAMNYWKDINPEYKLYPGEEVHAPGNPVHIIHFGGRYSINSLSRGANEEKYTAEVKERAAALQNVAPGVNAFAVAASEWVFDEIRKAGGLCVFCHPYWFTEQYVLDEGISTEIFNRRKFDAFEVLGGHHKTQSQSNNHQIVRYYEECAKGGSFPVVGLDDSHGTDRFEIDENRVGSMTRDLAGWYSTLVFSPSDSAEDLVKSIRSGYSAAVEKIEGESLRVYSSFRLTKYATFLMRWYFPMHDVLCADEGALMLRVLAGEEGARKALTALLGSVEAYRSGAFRNTAAE